jgi:hypothetical protein
MQILAKLTNIFLVEAGIVRRFFRSSSRNALVELAGDLKREMYGMDTYEQAVVNEVMVKTGQAVTIRRNTIAFGKNDKPCHLEKGSQVRIPGIPFRIDADRGLQIVVLDQNNRHVSMRLSDYMRDVYVGH